MSHQTNDGRTARYSEKRIIARQYIPFKTGESVAACILSQTNVQGNTKEYHVAFVKRHGSNSGKIRLPQTVEVKGFISYHLRHRNMN